MKSDPIRTPLLLALASLLATLAFCAGCADSSRTVEEPAPAPLGTLPLEYSRQFSIERFEGGYSLVHVADGRDYALVPRGAARTTLGRPGATVVETPCERIYLAASAATDLILRLDALDRVACCSASPKDCVFPEARAAIDSGAITYVGKYAAPDYETLLNRDCRLALESTMITHAPKVREQLERLGIPVFVERSNYESEPLGRLEWIKLYGALFGKEEEATAYFEREKKKVETLVASLGEIDASRRKKVAFFYVSSNGYVNVRKPGDYLCKIIDVCGGVYALDGLRLSESESNALSTVNVDWEVFYRNAADADVLIYNGAIGGGVASLEELFAKNELFREFKAVKTGDVWNSTANMYQEIGGIAELFSDFHTAISGDDDGATRYLTRLK